MRAATHSPYLCSNYALQNQLRCCAEGALDAVIINSLRTDYGIIQADTVAEAIASGHYGSTSNRHAFFQTRQHAMLVMLPFW